MVPLSLGCDGSGYESRDLDDLVGRESWRHPIPVLKV